MGWPRKPSPSTSIKKVADAYTTLRANIRAGNLGRQDSTRRVRAESKPIAFRADAAQPFDDRCLSWQIDARTVSIWTVDGPAARTALHRLRPNSSRLAVGTPQGRVRSALPRRSLGPDRHL